MENKIIENKKIRGFILLCCFVYFISYLTRKNYDAALVEIYQSLGIAKTLAGLASTGSVITYGLGQLLSGYLGDKFKAKYIIVAGLIVTAACNLTLPLFSFNIYVMIFIWCINGLAQAMMWPPMVKIMSDLLDNANYKKGVLYVTLASSISTIFIYILIPFCISVAKWQTAFYICSLSAAVMCIIWYLRIKYYENCTVQVAANNEIKEDSTVHSESKLSGNVIIASGFIPIAVGIILQGTLRDGVTTWMPTIVSETYNLNSTKSILSTVALPLLAIFSATIASAVQRKLKNEVSSAAIFYFISFASALVLSVFYEKSIVLSIIMMAIITACMHGINLMLVCEVPNYFKKYNKVSLISGVLNSFTYIGSAVSIYALAAISEKFDGWVVNFIIWTIISILGLVVCVITIPRWKKFRNEIEN